MRKTIILSSLFLFVSCWDFLYPDPARIYIANETNDTILEINNFTSPGFDPAYMMVSTLFPHSERTGGEMIESSNKKDPWKRWSKDREIEIFYISPEVMGKESFETIVNDSLFIKHEKVSVGKESSVLIIFGNE